MSLLGLLKPFLGPVSQATLAFPLVASALALPFALLHYRRHGHVHPWRAFLEYSFIYYLIAALFLVHLPLPELPRDPAALAAWEERFGGLWTPSLDPTTFLRRILHASTPAWRLVALSQALFNIALFLPLGFCLRYLFRRGLGLATLGGLGLSLAFELCQFTGIFGIYPGPYRLLDAGDLLLNTLGAFLGAATAFLLSRAGILPDLERLPGPRTPWSGPARRAIALLIDGAVLLATWLLLDALATVTGREPGGLPGSLSILLVLVLVPVLDRGRGPGRRLTFCAVRLRDGKPAPRLRVLARQAAAWGWPALAWGLAPAARESTPAAVLLLAGSLAWLCLAAANALRAAFGREHAGWLDRRLGTRVRNVWGRGRAGRRPAARNKLSPNARRPGSGGSRSRRSPPPRGPRP